MEKEHEVARLECEHRRLVEHLRHEVARLSKSSSTIASPQEVSKLSLLMSNFTGLFKSH
jgi:hypothetical protein